MSYVELRKKCKKLKMKKSHRCAIYIAECALVYNKYSNADLCNIRKY